MYIRKPLVHLSILRRGVQLLLQESLPKVIDKSFRKYSISSPCSAMMTISIGTYKPWMIHSCECGSINDPRGMATVGCEYASAGIGRIGVAEECTLERRVRDGVDEWACDVPPTASLLLLDMAGKDDTGESSNIWAASPRLIVEWDNPVSDAGNWLDTETNAHLAHVAVPGFSHLSQLIM